jgi:hypothetical protein
MADEAGIIAIPTARTAAINENWPPSRTREVIAVLLSVVDAPACTRRCIPAEASPWGLAGPWNALISFIRNPFPSRSIARLGCL